MRLTYAKKAYILYQERGGRPMDFQDYFPIWDKLTSTQREWLKGGSVNRTVKKGTVFHNGSADCTGLLLVESGRLRCGSRRKGEYPDYLPYRIPCQGTGAARFCCRECGPPGTPPVCGRPAGAAPGRPEVQQDGPRGICDFLTEIVRCDTDNRHHFARLHCFGLMAP